MIYSMTGYGRHEVEHAHHKINIEISSVNHRYCDLNIRVPRTLNPLEDKIRKLLKRHIRRGKVECSVFYTSTSDDDVEVVINEAVCTAYVTALRQLGDTLGLQDNIGLSEIMQLSDVVSLQKKSVDRDALWEVLESVIEEALAQLTAMREAEGHSLETDLLQKGAYVLDVVGKLETISPRVVEQYRVKLQSRLEKLIETGSVDPSRLATEVAIFADKCAIDEELTRLKSHVQQLHLILQEGGQVGRKLDFLMQEMNREANTIASKANDYDVTTYAVALKTEIEKMREQIQNIE